MEQTQAVVPQGPGVELMKRVAPLSEQVREIAIVDNETYISAGELLVAVKDLRREADKRFDPIIKKAHEAHKEAIKQKSEVDEPLAIAQRILAGKIKGYDDKLERERREEQRRREEELRKQEEERKLQEAVAAEEAGEQERAEAIIEKPVEVTPVTVQKDTPKVQGMHFRTNWRFRVVDETKVPRQYLVLDMSKIGKEVRDKKDKTDIPGIEAYPDKGVV